MNCNTCRYELSQCLDGRLPSGRRTVVMQHVSECEACASFWNEMQAAQRLTLRLPREEVGADFRERLFERIGAGEGSPEAMFRDPVPVMAKVRYAFTGAAAAAAMLFVGLWLQDGDRNLQPNDMAPTAARGVSDEDVSDRGSNETGSNDGTVSTTAMAQVASAGGTTSAGGINGLGISERRPGNGGYYYAGRNVDVDAFAYEAGTRPFGGVALIQAAQPMGTMVTAQETARQLEARYRSVNYQLGLLRRQPQQIDVQIVVRRIVDDASELRLFADLLLEMQRHQRVRFDDPEIGSELELAADSFRDVRVDHSLDAVRTVVATTVERSPRLGTISRKIAVRPGDRAEDAQILMWLNRTRPEVFRMLFIPLGPGDVFSPEFGIMRQSHVLYFSDPCGNNLVAPRSEVEMLNGAPQVR